MVDDGCDWEIDLRVHLGSMRCMFESVLGFVFGSVLGSICVLLGVRFGVRLGSVRGPSGASDNDLSW